MQNDNASTDNFNNSNDDDNNNNNNYNDDSNNDKHCGLGPRPARRLYRRIRSPLRTILAGKSVGNARLLLLPLLLLLLLPLLLLLLITMPGGRLGPWFDRVLLSNMFQTRHRYIKQCARRESGEPHRNGALL